MVALTLPLLGWTFHKFGTLTAAGDTSPGESMLVDMLVPPIAQSLKPRIRKCSFYY